MYSRIIQFEDFQDGNQYLFKREDFHLLQSWLIWMSINHAHRYIESDPTSAEALPVQDTNVIIHSDAVHGESNRPVGFAGTVIDTYLMLSEHVSNSEIHNDPTSNGGGTVADGQLVARGWTEPIKVTVVISRPLFEIMGYTEDGPLFMPFPHDNMAPSPAYQPNSTNNMEPSSEYLNSSPLYSELVSSDLTSHEIMESKAAFLQHSASYDESDPYASPFYRGMRYPYPSDAKRAGKDAFLSEFGQFLYIIPPYLCSPLNLKEGLDKIVPEGIDTSQLGFFYHSPLFIDSRHTRLLDRVNRSGITSDEILNFRDLLAIFPTDSERQDLFNTKADHTCWLTKYSPIGVLDQRSNVSQGAYLYFNDQLQEINQFLSQVNYPGAGMETVDGVYWDFPFRTVTMDVRIHADDPYDLATETREGIVERGFPNCLYQTNFDNYLVEAGGHNDDIKRPKEDFYFDVYMDGVIAFKRWFKNNFKYALPGFDPENLYDYFDKLNVPFAFDDGQRQVLVLKDPNFMRRGRVIKRNPYSNLRTMGYVVLDGYITVPYEAYVTSVASSIAGQTGFGEIQIYDSPIGDPTAGGGWKKAPDASVSVSRDEVPVDSGSGTGGGGSGGAGGGGGGGNGPGPVVPTSQDTTHEGGSDLQTPNEGGGLLPSDPCDNITSITQCLACCGIDVSGYGSGPFAVDITRVDGLGQPYCLSGQELEDLLNSIKDCLQAKCPSLYESVTVLANGLSIVTADGVISIVTRCYATEEMGQVG